MNLKTDLSKFDNSWYKPGGAMKRVLWYFVQAAFFRTAFPVSKVKVMLLRLFGAKIGVGVVIKPHVRIKYPWKLKVGNHTWIGEEVWIDNLAMVTIGNNCCLSQGALLLCGNHDYSLVTFDLIIGPIVLEDGAWTGAMSVVGPGVTMQSHAVLSAGSVATKNLDAFAVYQGVPAVRIRDRVIKV